MSEVCLCLLLSSVMVTNISSHAHLLCGCWEFKRRFDCIHSTLAHPQIYFPSSQVLFISEALTPIFWSLSSALLCYHSALNPFKCDQARMLLFTAPSHSLLLHHNAVSGELTWLLHHRDMAESFPASSCSLHLKAKWYTALDLLLKEPVWESRQCFWSGPCDMRGLRALGTKRQPPWNSGVDTIYFSDVLLQEEF